MILFLNGSFGVGKSTVARLLRKRIHGSAIYDPEPMGVLIRRPAAWLRLAPPGSDDFQDIPLWRRLTVLAIRLRAATAKGALIVPMTFDDPEYFEEVTSGAALSGREVRVFRLAASSETVRRRLEDRERAGGEPVTPWVLRRAAECAEAYADGRFGFPIDTENTQPEAVAARICELAGLAAK